MNASDRTPASSPNAQAVKAFWGIASTMVDGKSLEAILGQRVDSSLRPPSVSLAETRQAATELAQAVRDGKQTEFRVPLKDYQQQRIELPQAGDLLIVCDGNGIPLTLIRTTDVRVTEDGTVVEAFTTVYPPLSKKDRKKLNGD